MNNKIPCLQTVLCNECSSEVAVVHTYPNGDGTNTCIECLSKLEDEDGFKFLYWD